jgi:ATP phosphoribosyltransferase
VTNLRVAVPSKGGLSGPAAEMLSEAGYRQRDVGRELMLRDVANGVDFYFLRPRDVAVYVGSGTLDAGITGRDLLLDSGAAADEILPLDFGHSSFRFAVRPGSVRNVAELDGSRIATSFAGILGKHLAESGLDAEVVHLDGAVENAIALGVADAIADVVETGATLQQAGLEPLGEPIMQSEAVLIVPTDGKTPGALDPMVRRLQGVLTARRYVMMDYDIRAEKVDEACAITPGIESPTVSPLHREGWVAVRAMVPRAEAQRIMDDLWLLGARGILVTDILATRL